MAAWKPPPPPSRRRHLDAVIAGLCPDCTRIVERGLKQQRFLDATPGLEEALYPTVPNGFTQSCVAYLLEKDKLTDSQIAALLRSTPRPSRKDPR